MFIIGSTIRSPDVTLLEEQHVVDSPTAFSLGERKSGRRASLAGNPDLDTADSLRRASSAATPPR